MHMTSCTQSTAYKYFRSGILNCNMTPVVLYKHFILITNAAATIVVIIFQPKILIKYEPIWQTGGKSNSVFSLLERGGKSPEHISMVNSDSRNSSEWTGR